MGDRELGRLASGVRSTSLGTLASRVLGMVRDMAMAALFGLDHAGVMDAFALAFRLPNLARRLFGEGALTASFLPVFAGALQADRRRAWKLGSVLLAWLTAALAGLTLLGEIGCLILYLGASDQESLRLLAGLTAVMLPYLLPICLAAQTAAMLNALGDFRTPAWTPAVLNVCWIAVAWWAPQLTDDRVTQAYLVAATVTGAGFLQLACQWPGLRNLGFRWDYDLTAVVDDMRRIGRQLAPMVLGLAVTQLNTLADSLIAFSLARPNNGPETIPWLGHAVRYPLTAGANAAVYYGERLYQFPLGIVGMAVATAIYPLLSRRAAEGNRKQLGQDLTLGLRMAGSIGLPAGVGLFLLAEPIADLLFRRGEFSPEDVARTAKVIAGYSLGVWAYCGLSVLIRGFYALGDPRTPVRVGAGVVAFNLALNLLLVWPLAEQGLALATSATAGIQFLALAYLLHRSAAPLDWPALAWSAVKAIASTAVMVQGVWLTMWLTDRHLPESRLLDVLVPTATGGFLFLLGVWVLRQTECQLLFQRSRRETEENDPK